MKQERIGNDIGVIWSILQAEEQPLNLERYNCTLYLKNSFGKTKVDDFKIEGNVIRWTFKGKDQKNLGKHSLTLVLNEGIDNMHTTDVCNFIDLVPCSCKIGGNDEKGVETITLEIKSTVDFFSGTASVEVDGELSLESENPVQNKVITSELAKKADKADIPTKVSELENDAEYVTEQTAMRDYQPKGDYATETQVSELSAEVGNKQDTISDLENIRSGAAKGATALQSVPDTYATKQYVDNAINEIPQGGGGGSYDDTELREAVEMRNVAAVLTTSEVAPADTADIKALAMSLGKYGVVTQTLSMEGSNDTGYRVVASNPQYGMIPQSFIDEVTNFGGFVENNRANPTGLPIFNEETGYFEYRGITNLAYDEMIAAYEVGKCFFRTLDSNNENNVTRGAVQNYANKLRVILHCPRYSEMGKLSVSNVFRYVYFLELAFWNSEFSRIYLSGDALRYCFYCPCLKDMGWFDASGFLETYQGEFNACRALETAWFKNVNKSIRFNDSPLLKNECILYMIENAKANSTFTITLHPTAYARAMADESIVAALEARPTITLASA